MGTFSTNQGELLILNGLVTMSLGPGLSISVLNVLFTNTPGLPAVTHTWHCLGGLPSTHVR